MAKEHSEGDPDDLSFLRTVLALFIIFLEKNICNKIATILFVLKEDFVCLNCSVITQNGINRRMALAAEAFGNKMCFLEDITLEVGFRVSFLIKHALINSLGSIEITIECNARLSSHSICARAVVVCTSSSRSG
jgi:hypothetical protein